MSFTRKIITTADGSSSLFIEEWNEHYHSKHGALREARHVFLDQGFHFVESPGGSGPLRILEIGFGTGLNALLTLEAAVRSGRAVHYTGVEAFPVVQAEWQSLNYAELMESDQALPPMFEAMHMAPWEAETEIHSNFTLIKRQQDFRDIRDLESFDLIYFDAFGARVQPELWEEAVFMAMYRSLVKNGVLVTYSSKGSARRAMQACGFEVSKLPGPPGKREMVRAVKKQEP